MKFKKVLKVVFLGFLFGLLAMYLSNRIVTKNASTKLYFSVINIPKKKVGLLLGTIKYLADGRINLYYQFRVDAAVKLFKENKIEFIIVSGDNGSIRYDEPTAFKEDLIKAGIPENKIFLDYAGFRTLDSVVRVKEIFGQEDIIVISQKFHNERAIYLAEHFNIKAVGFNAKNVQRLVLKVQIREYLARVKMFLDILTGTKPKFLGEKVKVE